MKHNITFTRLTDISPKALAVHMSDPRVAKHMPLLKSEWDISRAERFVAEKECYWQRDGLGHWAFLDNGHYVGWGGFQKEGKEWDFGLVLKPDHFGFGLYIIRQAIIFAKKDKRIPYVTFLLPPSRTNLRGLERLGAVYVGQVEHDGVPFLKYQLETP